MIHFIDLRFQGAQNRFAFWDTVTDQFVDLGGSCAWQTLDEFLGDGEDAGFKKDFLGRCVQLCPEWVQRRPTDQELDFQDGPETLESVQLAHDSQMEAFADCEELIASMLERMAKNENKLASGPVSSDVVRRVHNVRSGVLTEAALAVRLGQYRREVEP